MTSKDQLRRMTACQIEDHKIYEWVRKIGFPIAVVNHALCNLDELVEKMRLKNPATLNDNLIFTCLSTALALTSNQVYSDVCDHSLLIPGSERDKKLKFISDQELLQEELVKKGRLIQSPEDNLFYLETLGIPIVHPLDASIGLPGKELDYRTTRTHREGIDYLWKLANIDNIFLYKPCIGGFFDLIEESTPLALE